MIYPEVEKYFKKDKYYDDTYRILILEIIDKIYKQISSDIEFHNWCRCKNNRYEDLYNAFIDKVEYIMPIGHIGSEEFRIYNFLHNEEFYNIWTNDVLRLLIKMKREQL